MPTPATARFALLALLASLCAFGGPLAAASPCVRDAETACLLNGRFEVRVRWQTASQAGGGPVMSFAGARAESDQSAFFYFFDAANFEMGVKMVDACVPPFEKYWAFVSGLTNVGFTVTLRDSLTNAVKEYSNPLGSYPQTVGDTSALPCGGEPAGLSARSPAEAEIGFVAVEALPKMAPAAPPNKEFGLDILGGAEWSIVGNRVRIRADQVTNSRSTASGPLALELVTSLVPIVGEPVGVVSLGGCLYAPLAAGASYPSLLCDAQYTPPDPGCYYVTILLLEQINTIWYYVDWIGSPERQPLNGGCGGTDPCVRGPGTACLLDGRFEVKVDYRTQSATGAGALMAFAGQRAESDQSAFFYFFDNANFEMGVKMVDACLPPFNRFWAFVSGLTNQGFTVTVRDTATGRVKSYTNPLGTYPQTVGDTDAFPCF